MKIIKHVMVDILNKENLENPENPENNYIIFDVDIVYKIKNKGICPLIVVKEEIKKELYNFKNFIIDKKLKSNITYEFYNNLYQLIITKTITQKKINAFFNKYANNKNINLKFLKIYYYMKDINNNIFHIKYLNKKNKLMIYKIIKEIDNYSRNYITNTIIYVLLRTSITFCTYFGYDYKTKSVKLMNILADILEYKPYFIIILLEYLGHHYFFIFQALKKFISRNITIGNIQIDISKTMIAKYLIILHKYFDFHYGLYILTKSISSSYGIVREHIAKYYNNMYIYCISNQILNNYRINANINYEITYFTINPKFIKNITNNVNKTIRRKMKHNIFALILSQLRKKKIFLPEEIYKYILFDFIEITENNIDYVF